MAKPIPEMPSSVFVALVGRPNVGKSSLTNYLVGEKVAIVTKKPQTTRSRITGVITKGPVQYVLMDTPGIHAARNKLDARMTQTAAASLKDVDVTMMLFEPAGEFTDAELTMVKALQKGGPAIAVINKVDLLDSFAALETRKKQLEEFGCFDHIVTISAKDGTGCDELFAMLKPYGNEGPHYFDDDAFTDMPEKELDAALGGVVEACVNAVGVDLNTASAPLLKQVAGLNATTAKNIVAYREENGAFTSRAQIKKVPKLGPKAFEQCAGFMRITGGKNPLDGTSVHPESYEAVEKLFAKLNMKTEQISEGPTAFFIKDYKKMAEEIGVGEITLRDIIKELQKPGRDPRDEMPRPILRTDVLDMKDLKVGMILKGTVRNVIDFGAFVDIGVHQDGLVHISQMTKRFIKHPLEAVSVGDIVEVKVISLDLAKKRIGLSMLLDK